jgi:hypothetical protein
MKKEQRQFLCNYKDLDDLNNKLEEVSWMIFAILTKREVEEKFTEIIKLTLEGPQQDA